MNETQKNGIKALLGAVNSKTNKATNIDSLSGLAEAFFNTENKENRQELLNSFKERHMELAEFFKDNPELINAEAERALVSAIASGNANAALRYLERQDPKRWSDDDNGEQVDNTITIVRAERNGKNGKGS